jgi:hypothetical protein
MFFNDKKEPVENVKVKLMLGNGALQEYITGESGTYSFKVLKRVMGVHCY